jgi:NADH-quinone oxidoreductase subunit F
MTATAPENTTLDIAFVDRVVAEKGHQLHALIPILQAIQEHYRWLPPEALRRLCELTEITPAQVAAVATFYTYFRHRPAGKHRLCVCHGTACHVKGSPQIQEALERHLKLEPGQDTDADGVFTVEKVACVGCCTLAPVAMMDGTAYGYLKPTTIPDTLKEFLASCEARTGAAALPAFSGAAAQAEIRICLCSSCVASGALKVLDKLTSALQACGVAARIRSVGCLGICYETPLVEIVWPGDGRTAESAESVLLRAPAAGGAPGDGRGHAVYSRLSAVEAERVVQHHFRPATVGGRIKRAFGGALDKLLTDEVWDPVTKFELRLQDKQLADYLGKQVRIATAYGGSLDPLDLDAFLAWDGFKALRKVVNELGPEKTISEIRASGLRGRGGAGFPTGEKWSLVRASAGQPKYLICNGDEGDPGAFMDRMILESFPYRVLEGMAIAAYCVGAREGYLYIRAEYPLAVKRIREALRILDERQLLGEKTFQGKWSVKFHVSEGAGAFVCGEETALIASIEGRRGFPRLRPPYPAESGLWGQPTCVNNVETLSVVPWIIRNGPQAFASLGTESSKGTKVFALAGKVLRGGLIEVPMGITINEIVENLGGGVGPDRKFKAVQIGGPSGGCIPASLGDTPVDYEALRRLGAMMGSGGFVVLDDRDCMVDIARYFLRFTQDQSCGQCTACRIGTRRMLDILDRLCTGQAQRGDVEKLAALAKEVARSSLCGLGQTAPNPVLTTLKYFPEEYEAHLEGHCPAGKCAALIKYVVTDRCIGCTRCAQRCPVEAIAVRPYQKHEIDLQKCTRCDICRQSCPVQAIEIQ